MAEDFEMGGSPPEAPPSNRTFVIAAAGIGGLLVLSMICLGAYAFLYAPRQREARNAQATQIILDNTAMSQALTQTAQAARFTPTKQPTRTSTPAATATRVVAVSSPTVVGGGGSPQARTATPRSRTPTPTALPRTGFADEVGLPGLLLLGIVLLAVIIAARSLRARSTG